MNKKSNSRKKRNNKKEYYSYILTLFIILTLFFVGSTKALELRIENLPNSVNENQTLNFDLVLDLNPEEIIPIQTLELKIFHTSNNSNLINCTFNLTGENLNGCEDLTITASNNIQTNYGKLLGYDEKTQQNITFPQGYGYGYNFGYGYGYGYGYGIIKQITNYVYNIEWNTPSINDDLNLKIMFYATASANNRTHTFEVTDPKYITIKDLNKLHQDNHITVDNTRLIIPENNNQSNITIYPNTYNFQLDFSDISNTSGTTTNALLKKQLLINLANDNGNFIVSIPDNTLFTASNWDSIIRLPLNENKNNAIIPEKTDYTTTKSINLIIGSDQTQIYTSNAIRIQFNGEKDKLAGFIVNDIFEAISQKCLSDTQAWANTNLGSTDACTINSNNDLVIWTKHFTEFITYTQTKIESNDRSSTFTGTTSSCNSAWRCNSWTVCNSHGEQFRTCDDMNDCNNPHDSPLTFRTCNPTPITSSSIPTNNISNTNQTTEIITSETLNPSFLLDEFKSQLKTQTTDKTDNRPLFDKYFPFLLTSIVVIAIIIVLFVLFLEIKKALKKK